MIYTKDPDDVAEYAFSWDLGTDTISTVSVSADTGLTVDSTSNDDSSVTAWLSGGSANSTYLVRCRITTAGGRTLDKSMTIRCFNA